YAALFRSSVAAEREGGIEQVALVDAQQVGFEAHAAQRGHRRVDPCLARVGQETLSGPARLEEGLDREGLAGLAIAVVGERLEDPPRRGPRREIDRLAAWRTERAATGADRQRRRLRGDGLHPAQRRWRDRGEGVGLAERLV